MGWRQVVLPCIAGFAHMNVFYYAAVHNVLPVLRGDAAGSSSEDFQLECYLLDRAIFTAYVIDLLSCYFGAIPFSRCNSSKDIIQHHLPTLLLALPLAIPWWANIQSMESALPILDLDIGSELRKSLVMSYMMASGFAYVSSLNEVFMCFQRVEMSLQGAVSFDEIPNMKMHVFTSRLVIGTELTYKLSFFWGLSICACKGCIDSVLTLYKFASEQQSTWKTLTTILTSPVILRALLFLLFSVVMYPSMGARCRKKLKQFYREGEAKKNA